MDGIKRLGISVSQVDIKRMETLKVFEGVHNRSELLRRLIFRSFRSLPAEMQQEAKP